MKIQNLLLIAIFLILASCERELNINPEGAVSGEQALSSEEGLNSLLVGTYAVAGRADLFGGDLQLYADLLGNTDQLSWYGTSVGLRQIFNRTITSDNAYAEDTWGSAYKVIFQANTIMDNLQLIASPKNKNKVEGEARFLRAINYFELLRYFGKAYEPGTTNSQLGVPIITKPMADPQNNNAVARNTVEEGYALVVADLQAAASLLPSSNSYFADKYAAQAMLARVYLQMGSYSKALEAANSVINDSGRSLMPAYAQAFNSTANTAEDLFAFQVTSQSGGNDLNRFYADDSHGGRGDLLIDESYLDLFEEGDERGTFFYDDDGDLYTAKFLVQYSNIHIIRLAEMYLIRSECNIRLGSTVGAGALDDINTVRARAGAGALNAVTLDDIFNERRRELAFEGFLLHDIKRFKKTVDNLAYDSNKLVLPIPVREIFINPLLVQNPGYN